MTDSVHRRQPRGDTAMLGFKSFAAVQDTLVGIECIHMIKKRQMVVEARDEGFTAAEQFDALAA
jgi:transposase-like protein